VPDRRAALRALLPTVLAVVAVLALRAYQNRDVFHDRFTLPAFDGHVYAAMAEEPRVFTIAPWGYRLLVPWLVHLSPWNAARGFAVFTPAAILAAGIAAGALLRRLGHGPIACALGSAALVASDPVARILRYRILVDPLTVALEVGLLLAMAAGASWPVLALVGVLGTASKEFFLLLLPAVFFARLGAGWRRAALETGGVVAPSLLLTLVLRAWWTPYLPSAGGGVPPVLARVSEWASTQTASAALLAALAAIAAAGATREAARPWRWPFAFVALVAFAAPFLNPSDFSAPDLPRLAVFVLPPLLPMLLLAFDRIRPIAGPAMPAMATTRALGTASLVIASAVALAPFVLLDRYRRVDLRGDDADIVLWTCRASLYVASRFANGEEIAQTAVPPGPGEDVEPRMRWYLREGWQPTGGVATLTAPAGTILVPARPPRPLEVALEVASDPGPSLRLAIEGRPLDVERVEGEVRARLPADALVRGDNVLRVTRDPAAEPLQLRRLRIRPMP
jgi:hypothetical protein